MALDLVGFGFVKTEYVLITPVHNEEKHIGQLVESVIAQTILPKKWVVVDDASEDKTCEIVERYQRNYDFIEYFKLKRPAVKSYYSRRTEVFLLGYERVKHLEHDFVAALDADLTIPSDYYENILNEFKNNPRLGIASGVYVDNINGRLRKRARPNISTSGGMQVFRRECYDQIGGYTPLKYGGDDSLAEYTARMKGWQTKSFPTNVAIHHRPVGTRGGKNIIKVRFRQGLAEYSIGYNIFFVLAKSFRLCFIESPLIIGGLARICGFFSGYFNNYNREAQNDVIRYMRKEQLFRLFFMTPPCKSNGDKVIEKYY
jgi:glycosyltransferase involved in cell wall biosynthesis